VRLMRLCRGQSLSCPRRETDFDLAASVVAGACLMAELLELSALGLQGLLISDHGSPSSYLWADEMRGHQRRRRVQSEPHRSFGHCCTGSAPVVIHNGTRAPTNQDAGVLARRNGASWSRAFRVGYPAFTVSRRPRRGDDVDGDDYQSVGSSARCAAPLRSHLGPGRRLDGYAFQ
jgi:hypothetical protein